MYNGIGLQTARGSGTNGYVQRNLSNLRPRNIVQDRERMEESRARSAMQPDAGILEHERKRKVEIKCLELRDELEDKGESEDVIEERVAALRKSLLEHGPRSVPSYNEAKALRPSETHALGAAKEEERVKMQRALGISSDYVEGEAFNRELQEQRRIERMEERERRQVEARQLWEQRREQARLDAERIIEEKRRRDAERAAQAEEQHESDKDAAPEAPPAQASPHDEHERNINSRWDRREDSYARPRDRSRSPVRVPRRSSSPPL
ncbi:RNA-splicing factor [Malassezia cuniculi]|uniref:RNA-splicing factor n=1 Tax=Malassezia cuniculi TaxID=948313 RepID=A0AAF0EP01_9BASI|nr:RNA-splicing factor [Malassezia cuniculi]